MILTRKVVKRVGAVTSAERGSLIAMALAEIAIGNVPPLFVFPRKNLLDCSFANGPEGENGSADKSEWMTGNCFLSFTEHFIKTTGVTKGNITLLLLINHKLYLAEGNGVVLQYFPTYSIYKLQPSDTSVYLLTHSWS
jgi:hypothetical protein